MIVNKGNYIFSYPGTIALPRNLWLGQGQRVIWLPTVWVKIDSLCFCHIALCHHLPTWTSAYCYVHLRLNHSFVRRSCLPLDAPHAAGFNLCLLFVASLPECFTLLAVFLSTITAGFVPRGLLQLRKRAQSQDLGFPWSGHSHCPKPTPHHQGTPSCDSSSSYLNYPMTANIQPCIFAN